MPTPQSDWKLEFEKDDTYLKVITKGDSVYQNLKFDRKSNYKSNILNSLGVLENPMTFAVIHQVLTTLSTLTKSDVETSR